MKKLFIFFLVLLLLFGVLLSAIYLEGKKTGEETADVVLVFGAMVHGDEPSKTLAYRCDKALSYLKENIMAQAILLGGQGPGENISEALAMKRYLVERGIQESRLILEEESSSTWTNLKQAKSIMKTREIHSPVIVCSSDYHLFRIKLLAKRLDMDVLPLAADTPKSAVIRSYVREVFALIKSFLVDR